MGKPPKCNPSADWYCSVLSSKTLNRTKSFSTSSYIGMENSVTSTLASSQLRAPVHRRSTSDSVTLLRKPYFINLGIGDNLSLEGDLGSRNGDEHSNISIQMSDQKFSYSSDNKNSSSDSEVRIMVPDNNSSHTTEAQNKVPNYDHCGDPKRIKRLLANRVAAQRSRLRKLEYVDKLKRETDNGKARLSILSALISYYETQCKLLEMKNYEMKEMVEALENEKAAKEAEFQALMEERVVLGLIYQLLQEGK